VNGSQSKLLKELDLYLKPNPMTLSSNSIKTDKLSALKTGLGITAETRNGASKTTCEMDDKNQIEEQFIS
jgi:hypothetical protein